ncbi:MAG TPA: fatty acid--CoA ligase family protein [Patescibacteria group bacterium]|nr:fatty acid--CoA ligase family protein [Patescibacteria group bacterium]
MLLNKLEEIFKLHSQDNALVWQQEIFTYQRLVEEIHRCEIFLTLNNIPQGGVVLISIDFSPKSIALLIALLKRRNIVALASEMSKEISERYAEIAGAQQILSVENENITIDCTDYCSSHRLIQQLQSRLHSGIIIFTSGSSGAPKAALHDTERFLRKFLVKRYTFRTLALLRIDHIGGLDTLFYTLYNAGTLVIPDKRNPETICSIIEKFSVEVLPASPSFLSLLLLGRVYERYNLSSLKYITYGAEYMPQSLLSKCAEIFPDIKLLQKYGTTETGTLRSKSQNNSSPWVKIGGKEFLTRVVNGKLEIKSEGLMIGYLNAPSPFTVDGWFQTNDVVEENEGYFRIKGREEDFINVGGNKVSRNEVEDILLEIDGVYAATVFAQDNFLLGKTLGAKIYSDRSDRTLLREEIRRFCAHKLEVYKIPSKIIFADSLDITERMKKTRS